jgi:hypothetical protein
MNNKNLIPGIILLACASFTVSANKESNLCSEYSALAREIMKSRQNNVPIEKVYEILKDNKLSIELLKKAHKEPLWATDSNKQKAINEFSNDVFMLCLESLDKKRTL